MNIRGMEWIIILVIVILLFGPTKIPGLARALGKSVSEFRSAARSSRNKESELPEEKTEEVKETEKT